MANQLSANTYRALTEVFAFQRMTKVQEATLPHLLAGGDALVKAKTGGGKTLAFLVPIIEQVGSGVKLRGSTWHGAWWGGEWGGLRWAAAHQPQGAGLFGPHQDQVALWGVRGTEKLCFKDNRGIINQWLLAVCARVRGIAVGVGGERPT